MFGLGIWEIAVIAVVALLVLGPEKLPDAARSIGKALRDFRRAGDDIKREMLGDLDEVPRPRPPVVAKPAEHLPVAANEPSPAIETTPQSKSEEPKA
jgi:TatA/E family protein of Tat protein translocase